MNALVGPGAHAGSHQQIDSLLVVGRAVFEELQCAMHAARFVAVHSARDEHHRALIAPASTAQRKLTIVIRWIVELSVFLDVVAGGESLDTSHDLVGITPPLALLRQPLRAFTRTPGHARSADRIRSQCNPRLALIFPARQIRTGRCGFADALHDPWQEHLVITQARDRVWLSRIAVPAMLEAVSIRNLTFIGWVFRVREELIGKAYRAVEEVVVHRAYIYVQFAAELFAEPALPVAAQDLHQIVVLLPVLGDLVVDHARALVPDRRGITIRAHRRENGLPDVPLIAAAPVGTKDEL